MRKTFLFLAMGLISVFCLLTNSTISIANVRIEWESGIGYGGPFYARFDGDLHTDEWFAVPFYRNPDCVPEDFNLLDFFDFNALTCESFVAGFEIWENGPGTGDPAPIQVSLKAAGPVHVYFIPFAVILQAVEDGILEGGLMMSELESLPGFRIGIATFYTETLHPSEAAKQTMEEIVAKGFMEEDSSVRFELEFTMTRFNARHVKIEFKPAEPAPPLRAQSNVAITWGEMKGKN